MSSAGCGNESFARDFASDLRVRDGMVGSPKTLPADSSVAELRRLFGNAHVATALLVDGALFAGAIDRVDLPADARDDTPAREFAQRDVETIEPDAPMTAALARMDGQGTRRLVVLDADGRTLCGLLCLTSDRSAFCQAG